MSSTRVSLMSPKSTFATVTQTLSTSTATSTGWKNSRKILSSTMILLAKSKLGRRLAVSSLQRLRSTRRHRLFFLKLQLLSSSLGSTKGCMRLKFLILWISTLSTRWKWSMTTGFLGDSRLSDLLLAADSQHLSSIPCFLRKVKAKLNLLLKVKVSALLLYLLIRQR